MSSCLLQGAFAEKILDSLDAHIAVVDARGTIIAVNAAWRHFAELNGPTSRSVCEGANYFEACEAAGGEDRETAQSFAGAGREILAGTRKCFECEYPCHSPNEQRWFLGRITRVVENGEAYLVIAHENITARWLAEANQHISEARDKAIIATAHDAIVVADARGTIMDWNASAERIFGFTAAEAIGSDMTGLIIPAECHEKKRAALNQFAIAGKGPAVGRPMELTALRKDGTTIPIELTLSAYRSSEGFHAVGIARDISRRTAEQQQLVESAELLEKIVSHIPYYVFWKDRELKYLGCNENFARIAGLDGPESIKGLTDFDMPWGATEAGWYRSCDQKVMESGRPITDIEETQQRSDGSQATLLTSKVPLRGSDGSIFGILGIFADITERKAAEVQLNNALEDATRKRRELEGLLRAAQTVLEHDSFAESARDIFSACKTLVGATSGYVALLAESGVEHEVLFHDAGGEVCSADPNAPMPIQGLRAEAHRSGRCVFDNACAASDWAKFTAEGHIPLENVLFAPLVLDGKAIGLLALRNKPGGFTREDADLAQAFGELATISLRSARSVELLRVSELRWSNLVRNIPDGIVQLDSEGRIVDTNPAASLILGLPVQELVGQTFSQLGLFEETALAGLQLEFTSLLWGKGDTRFMVDFHHHDGRHVIADVSALSLGETLPCRVLAVFRDVSDREKSTRHIQLLMNALQASNEAIVITDRSARIEWVNDAFELLTGYTREEAIGGNPRRLKSGRHGQAFYEEMWRTILSGQVWTGKLKNRRKDGTVYTERMTITPVRIHSNDVTHFVAIKADVTSEEAEESQRLQTQKLQSIGQLAAGIAHEINTPTQFVSDNTRFLRESAGDLVQAVQKCRDLLKDGDSPEVAKRAEALERALEALDFAFISEEVPRAIEQSLEGLERVTRIVRAMKDFSHPATNERSPADLNKAIESTVTIARNEWKYVADLDLRLAPDLPSVPVALGSFNQVILNLVVNAAHAIEEKIGRNSGNKGCITVETRDLGELVEIRVSDTGSGIAAENRPKVFEHFFTTKAVGKGTGQGLAVARSVIVEQHGGSIEFESEPGVGTTFVIRLPLAISRKGAD